MKSSDKQFKVSEYYRSIINSANSMGIVYHTLIGNGMFVSAKLACLLNEKRDHVFTPSYFSVPSQIVLRLLSSGLIVLPGCDEKTNYMKIASEQSGHDIGHLRLCVSESCNMNCSYCFMSLKEKQTKMPLEIAKKAISEYYNILRKTKNKGEITFFGGEPLLNWDVLKKSILFALKTDSRHRFITRIGIVTNGTLLNMQRATFFNKTRTAVSISLDGPRAVHNKVRKQINGKGSYDSIIRGIKAMTDVGYKPLSFLCTIGDHNIDALNELIAFASKQNIFLNLNTAFAERKRLAFSVSYDKISKRLMEAELFAKAHKVEMDGTWRWAYEKIFTKNKKMRHCMASGSELCIDCEGNIKPCPGFNEKYGTIFDVEEALSSDLYHKFCSRTALNIPECEGCDIEGLCAGGCMLNAHKVHNGDIFKKSESCWLFKRMFKLLAVKYLDEKSSNV
ncbi:MAG: radical SAM protein [Bacteroidales bacterium]